MRGSLLLAKLSAVVALLSLVVAAAGGRRNGGRWRLVSLWGFVLSSGVVWSAAPSGLVSVHLD
jgi:hypothetical protein